MAKDDNHVVQIINEELRLIKSPVIPNQDRTELTKDGEITVVPKAEDSDVPEFEKHSDATSLELFFDLFFAANYTVFSQTQSLTSSQKLASYVGYFSILWSTWFITCLYDVRYVTDSVFERTTRAIHLGVLVGFAVVAPNFNPSDQHIPTMRVMSLILMVHRLCLAVQYGSILWHARKWKKAHIPFYIQIAINFSCAAVYLGIAFRFHHGNSRVFVTWYIVGFMEIFATIIISNLFEVLSLTRTHLMKRVSLLTVLILGDGVIVIGQDIVKIVKTPDAWNIETIGVVCAALATTYFCLLVYFDWMRYSHLPSVRQQIWATLHFPFHLALIVFMQGFTQFVIWSKVTQIFNDIDFSSELDEPDVLREATSEDIKDYLTDLTDNFFEKYPMKNPDNRKTLDQAINNVTDIDDSFWEQFAQSDFSRASTSEWLQYFSGITITIQSLMVNNLFETLGVNLKQDLPDEPATQELDSSSDDFQLKALGRLRKRYTLMFAYGYIASGAALILLTILTIVSHVKPWRPWHIIKTVIFLLFGLAIGLVALIYYNVEQLAEFMESAWLTPTICLVWFTVLTLTHIQDFPWLGEGRSKNITSFFDKKYFPLWNNRPREASISGDTLLNKTPYDMEIQPIQHQTSYPSHNGFDGSSYNMSPQAQDYGMSPSSYPYENSSGYEPFRRNV